MPFRLDLLTYRSCEDGISYFAPHTTIAIDCMPIPENDFMVESTSPSTTTTAPEDHRLIFGFGNARGEQKQVVISDRDIPRANLTVLTDWLESLDQLKTFLQEIQTDKEDQYKVKCLAAGAEKAQLDALPLPEKIQKSIKQVEAIEQKIETELRKPEKDWNYSVEEDEAS